MYKILLILTVGLWLFPSCKAQHTQTLTDDGAWCWFSGPRAIYTHNGSGGIITGWVDSKGSIQAASFNVNNDKKKIQTVDPKLDKDDHANPSFVELSNNDVLMSYTKHFDSVVRFSRKAADSNDFEKPEQHPVFDKEQYEKYPAKGVGYANVFALSEENGRIYCFGRWTGYKPNMMWSDDNGKTFTKGKVLVTNKPFNNYNRPYVRYYSDGKSKIHMVFTDGHPRDESTNSVYYACYENGAFWRADKSKICDLENMPFEPKDATVVYKATKEDGRAWVYDLAVDKKGDPVVLYARYPSEEEHLYHYARYNGKQWIDHKICHSGKWFPQTPKNKTEREPHYSAGMSFHPLKPNIVYLSKQVDGVFEIEKRETKNNGKSWKITPITRNSEYDNVRPVVPRNMKQGDTPVVLWMVNEKYVHYTDYKTRIDYFVDMK